MAKSGGGVQIEKYCKDTQLIDFKRLTYTHADDSRTLVMVALDKKYNIDIPEEEFTELKNVNETVAAIVRHLSEGA